MIQGNPDDNKKAREAMITLTEYCEGNDEFYLVIAIIRMWKRLTLERNNHCEEMRQPLNFFEFVEGKHNENQ